MATARKSSSSRSRSRSPSKKSSSSTKGRRKYGPKAQKMGKVMHEFKHGELKSGGRSEVKSRKQAIAIGLSEARKSGAKVPAPKKKAA